jgi:type II secretory pathway component PulF
MKTFAYTGLDARGRNQSGRLIAQDEANLEEMLRGSGIWLVQATAEKLAETEKASTARRRGSASRRELASFCTLMAFLTKVGIPLVSALDIAAQDCDRPGFAAILRELKRFIESGLPLAESLERFPNCFSKGFTSLIKAGESSGALPDAFSELKRYLEWQEQVAADVKQATIYPAMVMITTALFVLVLFTFVVPKFVTLMAVAKVALPWPTKVVFGVSDFAKATWWIWLICLTVLPASIQFARKSSVKFAKLWDQFWMRIPIIGPLTHMLWMSRLAQNLAVLYRNGVPLVSALKLCEGLVGSRMVGDLIADMGRRIEEGATFSESMRQHDVFPVLLVRMTAIGEKTGQLDQALENVAGYYNLIVPQRIKRLFSFMEPAMILFLVGIVGFVALAIFMPILSLMGSIR